MIQESYTINYQGKLLNESGRELNLEQIANELGEAFVEIFGGGGFPSEDGFYSIEASISLDVAESIDEVSDSDHLVVISDLPKEVNGNVPRGFPKVAHVNDRFFGRYWGYGGNNLRTALHEQAHQLGLPPIPDHIFPYPNLMQSGGNGTRLNTSQKLFIIEMLKKGSQNRGSNIINGKVKEPDEHRN